MFFYYQLINIAYLLGKGGGEREEKEDIFSVLKFALSEINITTPTFFWLVLVWYIFLIYFNVPVSNI